MTREQFYQSLLKILSTNSDLVLPNASEGDLLDCALQILEWTDDEFYGSDYQNCIAELERVLPAYLNYRDEEAADYRSVYGD